MSNNIQVGDEPTHQEEKSRILTPTPTYGIPTIQHTCNIP